MRILQRSVKNVKLESENWKKDHGFSAVMADAILENVESGLNRNKRRGRGKGKKNKRLSRFRKSWSVKSSSMTLFLYLWINICAGFPKFKQKKLDKFKQFSIGCVYVYKIQWKCHPIFIICADLEVSFTVFDTTMKAFHVLRLILKVFTLQ